jgi:hypothetical protein
MIPSFLYRNRMKLVTSVDVSYFEQAVVVVEVIMG